MRAPATLLLLLLVAAPAALQAQPEGADPRVERWLERAAALLERGRERQATVLIERAIERAPAEPRALSTIGAGLPPTAALAGSLSSEAQASRAEWALALLDRLQPGSARDQRARERLRAWARALRGEHEAALALTAETVSVHDEAGADALRRLGALFIRRDQLSLARRALRLALRAWSRDPVLVADLAALELARGAPSEAIRLLRAELAHRPRHRLLREDLAGALLAAGHRAEAIRLWRGLAADAPDDESHRRLRRAAAQAALAEGRYETARVEARRALGVDPSDGEARLLLGLALVGLDRPAPARQALRRAGAILGADDLRVQRALSALDPSRSAPAEAQR